MVVKHLQTNMRVNLEGDQAARQFTDHLLATGDGKFSTDIGTTDVVQLLGTFVFSIDELMSMIYVDLLSNYTNITWLLEHCILARNHLDY